VWQRDDGRKRMEGDNEWNKKIAGAVETCKLVESWNGSSGAFYQNSSATELPRSLSLVAIDWLCWSPSWRPSWRPSNLSAIDAARFDGRWQPLTGNADDIIVSGSTMYYPSKLHLKVGTSKRNLTESTMPFNSDTDRLDYRWRTDKTYIKTSGHTCGEKIGSAGPA
jgi:hypothetical protein